MIIWTPNVIKYDLGGFPTCNLNQSYQINQLNNDEPKIPEVDNSECLDLNLDFDISSNLSTKTIKNETSSIMKFYLFYRL